MVDVIHGVTPEFVAQFMQGFGLRAEIRVKPDDTRYIQSSTSGLKFVVDFDIRNERSEFDLLLLEAYFQKDEDVAVAHVLAHFNAWNRTRLFGTAYLDSDDQPALSLSCAVGETTTDHLRTMFGHWDVTLATFAAYLQQPHEP
ncbi:MAG: YbjN domain-containing protein [Pseudomonadota bacterium]